MGDKNISNDSRFFIRNHEARGKKHTIFQVLKKKKNCNQAGPYGDFSGQTPPPYPLLYLLSEVPR